MTSRGLTLIRRHFAQQANRATRIVRSGGYLEYRAQWDDDGGLMAREVLNWKREFDKSQADAYVARVLKEWEALQKAEGPPV